MFFFNIRQIIGKLNELELKTGRENDVSATCHHLYNIVYTEMSADNCPRSWDIGITFVIRDMVRNFERLGGGVFKKKIANCLI